LQNTAQSKEKVEVTHPGWPCQSPHSGFYQFLQKPKDSPCCVPSHATHSLQPLDVVLFAPLSSAYSLELQHLLHQSQGLVSLKKRDFFLLFWSAWNSSFKEKTICKSFEATGIFLMNAEVILQRFNNQCSSEHSDCSLESERDNSNWTDLQKWFDVAVADKAAKSLQKLNRALHYL
jgi:hypothetical protein